MIMLDELQETVDSVNAILSELGYVFCQRRQRYVPWNEADATDESPETQEGHDAPSAMPKVREQS